jgi:hypothetical protein
MITLKLSISGDFFGFALFLLAVAANLVGATENHGCNYSPWQFNYVNSPLRYIIHSYRDFVHVTHAHE